MSDLETLQHWPKYYFDPQTGEVHEALTDQESRDFRNVDEYTPINEAVYNRIGYVNELETALDFLVVSVKALQLDTVKKSPSNWLLMARMYTLALEQAEALLLKLAEKEQVE